MTDAEFLKQMKDGALKFVKGMKADNPQWSKEFAAGFERGAMEASATWARAHLARVRGQL